jgi:hypothetical protein
VPVYVMIVLGGLLCFGAWRIWAAIMTFREVQLVSIINISYPEVQIAIWFCLMLASVVIFLIGPGLIALICFILAVLLPVIKKPKKQIIEELVQS